MKIQFLGTAASEGIPSLFCTCALCKKSIQIGGKDIRTRTSAMIDEDLKIDFPPDSFLHMIHHKLDYEKVKDVLFTHSHSDHLYAEDLVARLPGYAQASDHVIRLYGNQTVIEKCQETLDLNGGVQGKFELREIIAFEQLTLTSSLAIPLPAFHDSKEACFIYYIEKEEKKILYGHDSGWFPEETFEWLKDKELDLVILECTLGQNPGDPKGHMNVKNVLATQAWLKKTGIIDKTSKVVVTHFSHNANLTHEELCNIFSPHGIMTAYDGMILKL